MARALGVGVVVEEVGDALVPDLVEAVGEAERGARRGLEALARGQELAALDEVTDELDGEEGVAVGALAHALDEGVAQAERVGDQGAVLVGRQRADPERLRAVERGDVLEDARGGDVVADVLLADGDQDEQREVGALERDTGEREGLGCPLRVVDDERDGTVRADELEREGDDVDALLVR